MGEDKAGYRINPEPMSQEMLRDVVTQSAIKKLDTEASSFHPSCAVEVKLRLSEEDAVSFYRILAQEWTYADIDSSEAEVFWRLLGAFEEAGVKGLVAKAQKRGGGHRLDE